MNSLRKTLAWCYAGSAIVFVWITISFFPKAIHAFDRYSRAAAFNLPWYSDLARRELISAILVYVVVPIALTTLFTIASWKAFAGKRSVRYWGIAASLVYLLLGVPLFIWLRGIKNPAWVLLALGVAGMVAFVRYRPAEKSLKPMREHIPGDGTNVLIDKLIWIVPEVAAFAIFIWLGLWGHRRGLAESTGLFIYVQIYLIATLVLLIHESGHALAGNLLGMKLLSFAVGPFHWMQRYGKWTFKFLPRCFINFLGFVLLAPVSMENFKKRKVIEVAAGPLANLLTCIVAAAALFTAPGHFWQRFWYPIAIFVTISLMGSIFSLVPYRIKRGYSDGAKLYHLFSGGLWADYHRAIAMVYSTLVSPLCPRDYDIETMQRAAGTITHGEDEMNLHLYMYSCYFQHRKFAEAEIELAQAEAVYENQKIKLTADGIGPFVFANAILRRDPTATRLWWNRMSAENPAPVEGDRWINYSAFLWMEGRLMEAREAIEKADEWAQQLPRAGAWDGERKSVALLRAALDEPAPTLLPTSLLASEE